MKHLAKYEPVRLYIYGLIGPIAAAVIGFGLWDQQQTLWIAGIILAVLSVPAAEAARNRVIPVEKTELTGNLVEDVKSQAAQSVGDVLDEVRTALPGMLEPFIRQGVDWGLQTSQLPTEVPYEPVDEVKGADAPSVNPYL